VNYQSWRRVESEEHYCLPAFGPGTHQRDEPEPRRTRRTRLRPRGAASIQFPMGTRDDPTSLTWRDEDSTLFPPLFLRFSMASRFPGF
jgi:hypothetical protein